jgi:hypothetical protein
MPGLGIAARWRWGKRERGGVSGGRQLSRWRQLPRLRALGIKARYGEASPELVGGEASDERRRATSNCQLSIRGSSQLNHVALTLAPSVGSQDACGERDSLWNWDLELEVDG